MAWMSYPYFVCVVLNAYVTRTVRIINISWYPNITMIVYIHMYKQCSKANKKGGCTVPWNNDPAIACLDYSRSPHEESIVWLIHHDFLGGRWPKRLLSGHDFFGAGLCYEKNVCI